MILNDRGGTRSDTLIKLVLVFFLSLLSFSVGTFVGKQFSDSQHRIAALEGGDADRAPSSATERAEAKQAVSEDEINRLSQEFVNKEKSAKRKGRTKVDDKVMTGMTGAAIGEEKSSDIKKDVVRKIASIKDEITSISKRIAGDKKLASRPVAKPKERAPASLPKDIAASSIGKYTVQISAFPDETMATARAEELRQKGISAFYIPATVNGKTWYRVSAGLFGDRKSAIEFASKIQSKKIGVDSTVIQKITK